MEGAFAGVPNVAKFAIYDPDWESIIYLSYAYEIILVQRHSLVYSGITIMTLMLFLPVISMHADAASVSDVTPKKGKIGQTGVIHGAGFDACSNVVVKFGIAGAIAPSQVKSDQVIKYKVPPTPLGPQEVTLDCDEQILHVGIINVIE